MSALEEQFAKLYQEMTPEARRALQEIIDSLAGLSMEQICAVMACVAADTGHLDAANTFVELLRKHSGEGQKVPS